MIRKPTSRNPRSTVGTVTEIYDYLRLLYARVGIPHCPVCGKEIKQQSTDQIIGQIMALPEKTRFMVLAPVVRGKKGMHEKVLDDAKKSGYVRVRVDGYMYDLSEKIELDKNKKHDIQVVVDRLVMKPDIRGRLGDSVEGALTLGEGNIDIYIPGEEGSDGEVMSFSQNYACERASASASLPRAVSLQNPLGAVPPAEVSARFIVSFDKICVKIFPCATGLYTSLPSRHARGFVAGPIWRRWASNRLHSGYADKNFLSGGARGA